jgi:hypothetical protein
MRKKQALLLRKALWLDTLSEPTTKQLNEGIATFKSRFRRLKKEYIRGRQRAS